MPISMARLMLVLGLCCWQSDATAEVCAGEEHACLGSDQKLSLADPTALLQLSAAAQRKRPQHNADLEIETPQAANATTVSATTSTTTALACHTAVPGEACFSNVEWAMQSGIHAHPEWYPELTAGASFEAFQSVLHAGGHSECPEPCEAACRTAVPGETCYDAVQWAMHSGYPSHPEWYPGLIPSSSFEEFQDVLHAGNHADCPAPCARAGTETEEAGSAASWAWQGAGYTEGHGWCSAEVPGTGFSLKHCPMNMTLSVKVLTYNLFWWNLFGVRWGNHGSAGSLIAQHGASEPFSVLAFQECDNVGWVLGDAGLHDTYTAVDGGHALAIAYRTADWRQLGSGSAYVAEDGHQQWYGKRAAHWVRLRHMETSKTIFVMNHHGPLPIPSGGMCGGKATAYNMLRKIAENADVGDFVVLAGDFNANAHSHTVWSLETYLHRIFTGTAIGGIDHFFSNCGASHVVDTRNLGSGGSDHDALSAVFKI